MSPDRQEPCGCAPTVRVDSTKKIRHVYICNVCYLNVKVVSKKKKILQSNLLSIGGFRDGGHVGGQKKKRNFHPLGINLFFHQRKNKNFFYVCDHQHGRREKHSYQHSSFPPDNLNSWMPTH